MLMSKSLLSKRVRMLVVLLGMLHVSLVSLSSVLSKFLMLGWHSRHKRFRVLLLSREFLNF